MYVVDKRENAKKKSFPSILLYCINKLNPFAQYVFYADYAKPQGFCDEAWKAICQ